MINVCKINEEKKIKVRNYVEKLGGDYSFRGVVVSIFKKEGSGIIRVVVQNSEGILHIFSPKQLWKIGK